MHYSLKCRECEGIALAWLVEEKAIVGSRRGHVYFKDVTQS